MALPGLTVVVRDHVEHFSGVGTKHADDVVAVGGHHIVVSTELVAVFAFEFVVNAGEVVQFSGDLPGVTDVLDADVVDVVVK